MDTMQKSFGITSYTADNLPPAQLFIGSHDCTTAAVEQLLQKLLCLHNNCNTCITCMQIREKQHHAIMWLHPEKNYTIDSLEDLFATLAFQLPHNEKFFFIIQKADFLTTACANKLLKPMEEPPTGYHFILLTQHPEQLLGTIKSRCITHTLSSSSLGSTTHPLYAAFTQKPLIMSEFSRMLDTSNINERESIELFDQILSYWFRLYQNNKNQNLIPVIQKLHAAQLRMPMPGSSVLFWRNLYVQMHNHMIKNIQN
jgi:DNA polymerase III subunit delta'